MKFPFINDPSTGKPDEMVTLTTLVTLAATGRFLLDGITVDIMGHLLTFNHVDSTTYLAFLAPIIGAHGYIKGKGMIDASNIQEKN